MNSPKQNKEPVAGPSPAPPITSIVGVLRRDALDMWGLVSDMPWPAVRAFLFSAFLSVILMFYCGKKPFYKNTVRGWINLDKEFFGYGRFAWYYLSTFVVLFLLAFAFARLVEKSKPRDLGLTIGDWRFGLRWTGIFLGIMIPVVFIMSFTGTFSHKYPLAHHVGASWTSFLVWESIAFLYFIGWEFYFRGYMLFTLYRYLGTVAIFVPMIPFVILHSGKPLPEALGAIFVAELLCVFALRSGSMWYGMIVHWTINVSMDVCALWQKGGLPH